MSVLIAFAGGFIFGCIFMYGVEYMRRIELEEILDKEGIPY